MPVSFFRAKISSLRCFRTPGAPRDNPSVYWGAYPVLSLHDLNLCKFVSRSNLDLISFWMLTIPWTFQEPISFYRRISHFVVFQDKSGTLLFLHCSHKCRCSYIFDSWPPGRETAPLTGGVTGQKDLCLCPCFFWEFSNLVVWNLVLFAMFTLFCALVRSFAPFCRLAFALFFWGPALLRSFACFFEDIQKDSEIQ